MVTGETPTGWLVFLSQLPSSPSSPRVTLWRRLRTVGATGMLNGAWVLPHTPAHAQFFEQLQEMVLRNGGSGFVLAVPESSPEMDEAIVQRFRVDRGREYDEFMERCEAFLKEIGKESRAGKFTFAELEEAEQDLKKLARWLAKIQKRDFFPDDRWSQATDTVERCRDALARFSTAVYEAEKVQEPARSPAAAPPSQLG
jgi:Protein ChrB, N-terminal